MNFESVIKELEKEVEMEEAATAIKKKVIADLKAKSGMFERSKNEIKGAATNVANLTQDDNGIIDLANLLPEQSKKPSFIDDVRDVIKRFGDQEFTVQHVSMVLKDRHGLQSDDDSQRSKISQALSKLKDTGFIEIKHKGAGNAPNRYVVSKHVNDTQEQ